MHFDSTNSPIVTVREGGAALCWQRGQLHPREQLDDEGAPSFFIANYLNALVYAERELEVIGS
jgi:hypothetical protein